MSVSVPNGALVAIASGYATAITTTAVSNATEAVVTAANAFIGGELVEVTSGWSRLTNKIVRVKSPTATTFVLEGYDTTNTTTYPVGSGIGSIRAVTGTTQLSQILTSTTDGGVQQFVDYQFLESEMQSRIPTIKSAAGLTFEVADDATQPGYILAGEANDDRLQRAVTVTLPSGSKILYNAYISLNRTPSLTINAVMASQVTLSLLAEPVRYTS
ncbi:MAG TPA: phage tail protein [Burkholderiales bacterium]|nr:phage tail protein [Burkholderiales bacterium]HUY04375.1 phage tail protein [Rhodocyclaceae bacterium]